MALLLQLLILVQVILHLVHLTLLLLVLGLLAVLVMVPRILVLVVMEDSLEETLMLVLVAGIGLCKNQYQEQITETSDCKHSLSAMMTDVFGSQKSLDMYLRR